MKNKKLYDYLPNLIISLFLAFIFLALSLLFAADNIFFEPTTYTNSMHKIKIEDTAFEEIQTYCEQQYAKNQNLEAGTSEFDEKWSAEFERLKEQLVMEQDFVAISSER